MPMNVATSPSCQRTCPVEVVTLEMSSNWLTRANSD